MVPEPADEGKETKQGPITVLQYQPTDIGQGNNRYKYTTVAVRSHTRPYTDSQWLTSSSRQGTIHYREHIQDIGLHSLNTGCFVLVIDKRIQLCGEHKLFN